MRQIDVPARSAQIPLVARRGKDEGGMAGDLMMCTFLQEKWRQTTEEQRGQKTNSTQGQEKGRIGKNGSRLGTGQSQPHASHPLLPALALLERAMEEGRKQLQKVIKNTELCIPPTLRVHSPQIYSRWGKNCKKSHDHFGHLHFGQRLCLTFSTSPYCSSQESCITPSKGLYLLFLDSALDPIPSTHTPHTRHTHTPQVRQLHIHTPSQPLGMGLLEELPEPRELATGVGIWK